MHVLIAAGHQQFILSVVHCHAYYAAGAAHK